MHGAFDFEQKQWNIKKWETPPGLYGLENGQLSSQRNQVASMPEKIYCTMRPPQKNTPHFHVEFNLLYEPE